MSGYIACKLGWESFKLLGSCFGNGWVSILRARDIGDGKNCLVMGNHGLYKGEVARR